MKAQIESLGLVARLIARFGAGTALREQARAAGALFLETLTTRYLGINGECAANFYAIEVAKRMIGVGFLAPDAHGEDIGLAEVNLRAFSQQAALLQSLHHRHACAER